ncbi:MAG: hypothetical protein KDC87_00240 [Planctomycetes bacterium]|nr:hypothetical protein [Planctomycetota bacterium]MCB9869728.1 hypothetical protein [Planctomycetota bacterium]
MGLYATLLVGLFGITFPAFLAPLENTARAVVCLPLRAYGWILGSGTVHAAGGAPRWNDALLAAEATRALESARGPVGYHPRICRVRDREEGPSGRVDVLELAATCGALRGAASPVTLGPALVGFLELGEDDRAPARVRLLHFQPRRRGVPLRVGAPTLPVRVAAQVECRELDARGVLRFLVEPARRVDPGALRCTALDDAYLAARLRHSGDLATTDIQPGDATVPSGLQLGRLLVFGYPRLGIPVGLFVEPLHDPRAISSVVVWGRQRAGVEGPRAAPLAGRFEPVQLVRYPAPRPVGERWMIRCGRSLPLADGAALVGGGHLLGVLRTPWTGQSLVTPFAASSRMWALLLLGPRGRVAELVGRVVEARGGEVRIELSGRPAEFAGTLFTGANGPACPAGLALGPATPDASHLRMQLSPEPCTDPQVFVPDAIGTGDGR